MTDTLTMLRRERDEIERAISIQNGRLTDLITRRDDLDRRIAEAERTKTNAH
ncbi:hypothetical protein ACX93W_01775 [Paenibacillus sp. CAU 1782]